MRGQSQSRTQIDVVFVGGTGRSGSTVIEHHLARRLAAPAVGETLYLWNRGVLNDHRCECGEPFSLCPWWSEVMEKARIVDLHSAAFQGMWEQRSHSLRSIPRILVRGRRDPGLDAAARAWEALIAAIAGVAGSTIIVESSKEPAFWLFLRLVPNVRVRTLHVIRDSRAVAFSWHRRLVRPELAHQRVELMGVVPYWKCAVKWAVVNLVFLIFRGRLHRGAFMTVKYEDFARSPDSCLSAIERRLGLEPTDAGPPDRPRRELRLAQHSVSGNPVRFDPERLAKISLDQEWRDSMPRRARALVGLLTLPLLVAYGYLVKATGPASSSRS